MGNLAKVESNLAIVILKIQKKKQQDNLQMQAMSKLCQSLENCGHELIGKDLANLQTCKYICHPLRA